MKPAAALLLAAYDLAAPGAEPFDVAHLAVRAWRRSPQSFGLSGFKAEYPDIRRVAAALAHHGPQNLLARGYLERVGAGQSTRYRLTPHGRREADRLLAPPAAPPAKPRYEVLTWDPESQKFTPQIGVRRGPYTLFGLRAAIRRLRNLGYEGHRNDNAVLVQRLPEKGAAAAPASDPAAKETA